MKDLYKKHLSKVLNTFDRLMNKYQYDEVVLYSGEIKTVHLDDNTYPFKAYFNFKYFAPILDYPNSLIIYKSGEKPKLVLFRQEDYWHSQPKDIEGFWIEFFDITYYKDINKIFDNLSTNLSKTAFLGEDTKRFEKLHFKSFNDKKVLDFIHFNRSYKSEYEVSSIRKANELASFAHKAAYKSFLDGNSELQSHLKYLEAIAFKESEVPYPNIVAYDENSAILHYMDYSTKKTDSKSFLLDAGASCNGYHSDITRTFVKDGHDEFKALIQAVDKCNLNIISKIKIGMNYEELQEQMHKDVSQILVDFKLMNISYDEIYEQGYSKIFSPTGVGHYLGLQVHDVGNFISDENGSVIERSKDHPYLRLRRDIEASNVFTIEPGVYIIEQLLRPHMGNKKFNWDNIKALKPYGGVRIEDNIYVGENQIENLTRPYFKEIDESSNII